MASTGMGNTADHRNLWFLNTHVTIRVSARDGHQDAQTACALADAWRTYTETSPHRPHSAGEALVWGKQ